MSDPFAAYTGDYWCAHCGQVTNRALWERYGGACPDCRAINGSDRHLQERLWLADWQAAAHARGVQR